MSPRVHRLAALRAARLLEFEVGSRPSTTAVELVGGELIGLSTTELAVVIDTAAWRFDIPTWRWFATADEPEVERYAAIGYDDTGWPIVPHLQPVFDAVDDRISWFRTSCTIPPEWRGKPVTLVLGGHDDEDWTAYRVYLNGRRVDEWVAQGRIRTPRQIVLQPGTAAYAAIAFDGPSLLAVRATGLDRTHRDLVAGEREHYFFQGWLLDQAVVVGQPDRTVDDFVVSAALVSDDGSAVELDLVSPALPALRATVRYVADGELLRKSIRLRNDGPAPLIILDVIAEDWHGAFVAADGGRGQPVTLDAWFIGLEHPAGVNQAGLGWLRIVQMPGIELAPGTTWDARSVVLGGDATDGAAAAFQRYLRGLRHRPSERLTVYSALGWYDFTNPGDPLPELTADLLDQNLAMLSELREGGVEFDIYMIDDWWDRQDLRRFRRSAYPEGGRAAGAAIRSAGMIPGLWWATSRALWTAGDAPGMEASVANAPDFGAAVALAGGTWRWLEEFANVFIGERRFCLAAEPYRSIYSEAIPSQIRDLGAGVLKLDCVVLHCTSSAHGHRPGRHSVEPMVDALIAMIAKCLEIAPNLRVIWYWGFRSPWFLGFGDMVFDKGLLMEAATPASSPLPTTRQAMSLNVDQSIRHARFLPLELQDSLGVWIGDVAWCNRVGRTEWREAFLLDSMRGSDLVQLWGDLDLFDLDDRAFLRDALRWIRRDRFPASTTIAIGGDPWRAEAYGYARAAGTGTLLALINPDSQAATVRLDRDLPGWPAARAELVELYPFPGRVATPGLDRSVELDLMPFELRLIQVVDGATVPDRVGLQSRPTIRPTRPLDLGEFERSSARPAGSAIDQTGTVRLPVLGVGDLLFIAHRFERDGQWTYDPEPHHLVSFGATIDGFAVHQETVPGSRDRNGPGAAWVIRRIPAGPAWSGRDLELSVGYRGPDGVEMTTTGAVVAGWWLGHRRRFEDLLDPGRSAPADQGQGRRSAAVTG